MSKSKFFGITLISIFFIFFTEQKTFGQVNLDSLWGVWNDTAQPDTIRLKAIHKIAWKGYLYSQPDSAFYYAQLEYDFAKSKGLKIQMAKALNVQGVSYFTRGDYSNAIDYYTRSLAIKEEIGDKQEIANSLVNIGSIYYRQGDHLKAIKYYTQCLTIFEEIGNKRSLAYTLINIGNVYYQQGDHTGALEYHTRALAINEELDDKKGISTSLNNIGFMYLEKGDYVNAFDYCSRSLAIREEIKDKQGVASTLNNIGLIHSKLGDYSNAIDYYTRSLVTNDEIGDKQGMARSLNSIGANYKEISNYPAAISYSTQALNIAQEVGSAIEIRNSAKTLFEVYKSSGMHKTSLQMYELYITTRDSIESEKNQIEILRQEFKYEYEKQKSEEDKIRLGEEKNKEIKNTRNYIIIFSGTGLLIILLIVAVFYVRSLGKKNLIINNQKEKLKKAKEKAEEANKAKSTFLSNMSHELRTPLNAILGFAQLMTRDVTIEKEQQERINIISRSGKHLLSLINGILDFAKIESGKEMLHLRSFNLSVFLNEIEELFKSRMIEKGLFFALEKDDDLPRYIKSDEGKLRQVLINLIGNAMKFSETGGVTLRVRADALAENIQTLHIEVEDTGIGIDSNQMESIFDPFVQVGHIQASSRGTGLGLAICKSFLELLKGEISVESKLGTGSLFRIELEVALAETAEAKSIEIATPAVLGLEQGQSVWRILVVEDNVENRLLLNSLLVQAGFDTRQAENGEEAVTLFEQWQPHFIWMDIRMPVMDGYQATAKIRSLPGGDTVKIVAITASAFGEQRNSIMEAGCDEVMHKPYQSHEIFEAMRVQLGVRYIYEEEIDKSPSSTEKVIDIELAKEMAGSLPKPLFNELKQSSIALDMEETYKVIERIAEIQPELAGLMRMYVEELDFSAIKNILNHE